jgi:hypothetical protein
MSRIMCVTIAEEKPAGAAVTDFGIIRAFAVEHPSVGSLNSMLWIDAAENRSRLHVGKRCPTGDDGRASAAAERAVTFEWKQQVLATTARGPLQSSAPHPDVFS